MSYLSYLLTLCSLYQFLSPYQCFVVLSNFCHLLAHCYLLTFYVIFSPYKCTCCTHHIHNSFSCLIVRTLSVPIYLINSPGVFDHRVILTMEGIGPWLEVSSYNKQICFSCTGAIATFLSSCRQWRIYWACEKKPAWSVGFVILGRAQGAQSPPQGNHNHDEFFTHVVENLNRRKGTNGTPS